MRPSRVFPRWKNEPVVRDRFKVTHFASAACFGAGKVVYVNGAAITCLWCMRAWLCGS